MAGPVPAMLEMGPRSEEAYDTAARELFGEHASLNFPEEGERAALGGGGGLGVAA